MKIFHREQNKIKKKKKYLVIVPVLAIIFILQIIFTPIFFKVSSINIEGQAYLTKEEIKVQSGIEIGQALVTLSINKTINNLLDNPWISSVEVIKEWPKVINITVTERVPCLAIPYKGKFLLIGTDGFVIDIKDNFSEVNLPILNGYVVASIEQNQQVMSEEQWYKVQQIYQSIPKKVLGNLSEIYSYRDNMALITTDGLKIDLGNISEFDHLRLKMLPEILKNIKNEEKGFLDLSGIYAVYRKS